MSSMTTEAAPRDVSAIVRFINLVTASIRNPRTARRMQTAVERDITFADSRVLVLLHPREQTTVGDIAASLDVDLSRASRQLGHLEKLGLVSRATEPIDRRPHWVTITDEGHSLLRTWRSVWVNDYLVAVDGWPTADIARLTELVGRLHRSLAGVHRAVPAVNLPPDYVDRAVDVAAGQGHRMALGRLAPVVIGFVEWVGSTPELPANHRALARTAKSPVAMGGLLALRVADRHGPLAVSALAERLGLEPSRASKYARELEEARLVVRGVDTLDRRSSRLRVTRRGSALLRRIDELQQGAVRESLEGWTREDADACASLLDGYANYLATGHVDAHGWAVPPSRARYGATRG